MRRHRSLALALILALACGPVAAEPPKTSPRPLPRPSAPAAETETASAPAPTPRPRPEATPGGVVLPSAGAAADPLPPTDPLPQAAPLPPADPRLAGVRPKPRPEGLVGFPPPGMATGTDPAIAISADPRLAEIRPLPRPEGLRSTPPPAVAAPAEAPVAAAAPKPPPGGVLSRLFGAPRKRNAPEDKTPAPAPQPEQSQRGAVCGVPGLIGQKVAPIGNGGRGSGCGIAEPVRITSVSGIRLSQPMTVDCETATAFKRWVDRGIVPAVGGKGGGIAKLDVGPGYVCRPRNNQRGAKLSEHGHGKAIDLMGLVLKNGQSLDVKTGWKSQPRILKAIHAAACGPFGTVLGPKADRYHQDHIHVDTKRYRSGSYCR